jgi:hypothetical protein
MELPGYAMLEHRVEDPNAVPLLVQRAQLQRRPLQLLALLTLLCLQNTSCLQMAQPLLQSLQVVYMLEGLSRLRVVL